MWSGKRDLNPRLRPWQGRTLPLSYSRSVKDGDTFIEIHSGCQAKIRIKFDKNDKVLIQKKNGN